jgi:hypothetical protein
MASYAEITRGLDETAVYALLTAKLQAAATALGIQIPASYWGGGDPIPTILRHGLSPLVSTIFGFASDIALGGFLRGAQVLAEADLATWNADPLDTFLGWLAQEVFAVTPVPPSRAIGTLRITNAGGPVTLPATFTVADATGLLFTLVGGSQTVPTGVSYVTIQAAQFGADSNVDAGRITRVITTIAGITVSNQPQPPSTSWLIAYGGSRESPASVAARCRANWARLAVLQTAPADAYRAAALDQRLTGTTAVRKVAVWQHFKDGVGQSPNSVTLYLAGDAGPVNLATAQQVQDRLRPYVGLHDELYALPCATAAYKPAATLYVDSGADVAAVVSQLELKRQALQTALPIGGTSYASDIRRAVLEISQVRVEEDQLGDFTPNKNALITLDFGDIVVRVGRP